MGVFLLTGCSRDSVEDVEFDVRVKNDLNNIRVGEPVTFLFDGNAEYISFFSGENGNNYANITRDSVGVADLKIACTIKQQYTDKEYRMKEMVHVYLSQDFRAYMIYKIYRKPIGQKFRVANIIRLPCP